MHPMGILRPGTECKQNKFTFEVYVINVKFSDCLQRVREILKEMGFESAGFSLSCEFLRTE